MSKYKIEYLPNPLHTDEGLIFKNDVRIRCGNSNCRCYPFVCYICIVCREKWWSHCERGTPPTGVCIPCRKLQGQFTNWALAHAVSRGILKKGSSEWWEIVFKGINPHYYCYNFNLPAPFVADICDSVCRKRLRGVQCNTPEVKNRNWNSYIKRQETRQARSQGPPEEYSCCREDGTPRGPKQPGRRARQRSKKLWRKEPLYWDTRAMLAELPQEWD